jgi:hypothetical protein
MSTPSNTIQFLDERDDVYLYLIDGQVKTVIKDDYTRVKYKEYNGNRIFYDFGGGWKIQETFNDRIFNCYKDEEVINIRDGNAICRFIESNNKDGYIEYFKTIYLRQHKTEYLEQIIESMGDRVMKIGDRYVVDERFAVDSQGTSYYLADEKSRYNRLWDTNQWKFLCTVADGNNGRDIAKLSIDTPVGMVELDSTCMTIIAKLNFFLKPNVLDTVFYNQLPKYLKDTLMAEYEAKLK